MNTDVVGEVEPRSAYTPQNLDARRRRLPLTKRSPTTLTPIKREVQRHTDQNVFKSQNQLKR